MTINTENRPQQRRRIKLINRDFQITLMIRFILVNAVILAVFGAALYLFLSAEVGSNLQSAHATYRTVGAMLFPIVLTLTLLSFVVLSVTSIVVVLYASHRVAGPIYRFHQALKDLGQRNFKTMTRIREDDQLAEVANALEQMRDTWASDVAELRRLTAEVRTSVGESAKQPLDDIEALLGNYRS
jgi:hypothetical protein